MAYVVYDVKFFVNGLVLLSISDFHFQMPLGAQARIIIMDAPVVEMVLNADVSNEHAGVSATLINKWHGPIYIDKRFIPQSKYLMSDWGNLSCSGVKIRYYGL